MTTPTLLQAAQKLQEVLHELCVEDYIEEILQEHLQKYGENYRSDRLARYRDEKLTYCNAMSEFIGAIEREKAKPQGITEVINDLDAKMYASFAMSPKPVSGTSSGRHCGACKHDIHPMPSRCYKCGVGDLSNWEPKP